VALKIVAWILTAAKIVPDLCGTDFAGREGDAPTYARIMPEIGVY